MGFTLLAATSPEQASSQSEALARAWRDYYKRALHQTPVHTGARDFLRADTAKTLRRLIPADASVLEVGCGTGDLVASLPNHTRVGIDELPEAIEQARDRHPHVEFHLASAPDSLQGRRFDAVLCDRLCHGVLDIRGLLLSLRDRVSPDGRIFLTTFNMLWELPARAAERLGWKLEAPTGNWLSDIDYRNLFEMAGLEVVRHEDRILMPADAPVLGTVLNRYLVKLPGTQRLALYRVYVLRRRVVNEPARPSSVTVVIPARNEAGNIEAAVRRTPNMGAGTELIFVEGGSSDDTWQRIQQVMAGYQGPLKVSAYRQAGKGKGDAVRLGFSKAKGEILMILDADLTVPPEDLPVFYDVLTGGQADYVHGTRLIYPMEGGAMRFFNKLGNMAFSQLFTYLLQQPIKDTLCGTKVLWRKDWLRIAATRHELGEFDPFGDFDLIFGAARLNLKIVEVPVRYRERVYGETNISRWKHGVMLLRMAGVAARKMKYV